MTLGKKACTVCSDTFPEAFSNSFCDTVVFTESACNIQLNKSFKCVSLEFFTSN